MKPNYDLISKFIIESLDWPTLCECAELPELETNKQAFEALALVYQAEYSHEISRAKNYQATFAEYLKGLPSCISVPFMNCEILELAVEWGSLPADYAERQADKILDNYWLFMAMQYSKAARKHGINLFY